jgi:hypothetical protein
VSIAARMDDAYTIKLAIIILLEMAATHLPAWM